MITAIVGINCSTMGEGEDILRLRSPINSKVTLIISRGGDEKLFDVVVVREDLLRSAGK